LRNQPKTQRDLQRAVPSHQCARCCGELYPGAACWRVNGRILCKSCLLDWTLGQMACFRRSCGEAEE